MVGFVIGHTEAVKANTHSLEYFIKVLMVALGDGTRRDLLSLGRDDNRSTVVVRSADKNDVLSQPAEISDIEVSRDIGTEVP